MAAVIVALLLIALVFSLGFAVEALFWVAIIALALWVVGFFVRGAERTWYRW